MTQKQHKQQTGTLQCVNMGWTHNVVFVSGFWLCQHQHSHKRVVFPWQRPKVCDLLVNRKL